MRLLIGNNRLAFVVLVLLVVLGTWLDTAATAPLPPAPPTTAKTKSKPAPNGVRVGGASSKCNPAAAHRASAGCTMASMTIGSGAVPEQQARGAKRWHYQVYRGASNDGSPDGLSSPLEPQQNPLAELEVKQMSTVKGESLYYLSLRRWCLTGEATHTCTLTSLNN